MENMTKALLISAGVLIAVMLLTLIVGFGSQISAYFTNQHKAKMVEQTVEFNNRFENYNGQTIRGSELISVMNRVIDYNNTSADMQGYDPVKMEIDLKNHQNDFLYEKDSSGTNKLFGATISNTRASGDEELKKVANLSIDLINNSGITNLTDDTKLQKLSAEISTVLDDSDPDYRAKKLKNILGYEVTDVYELNKIKNATKQYYQYMQFKRAMFKCTGVKYNTENQRVNEITFEVVLVTDASGTHIEFN